MTNSVPPYPKSKELLAGKAVLITAAAGAGIGYATAKRCIEEGARVMISDVHQRRLTAAGEALTELAGTPTPTQCCDVSDQADVDNLWTVAEAKLGHIDIVVNNAGLGDTSTIANMTDSAWSRVLDVTLTGTFRMVRAALRHMTPRKTGAIVNNASVLAWRAQVGQAHYAAAKAGVMALTRCAAVEAAPAGVRVNAVAPSLALHEHLVKVTTQSTLDDLTSREAFGRGAQPWEIANVIIMLASDYTTYMTGEVVSVSSQRA